MVDFDMEPIRVFLNGQKTMGYDQYPVVRKRLTELIQDLTTVFGHRIRI
jgi:hypothetical protein